MSDAMGGGFGLEVVAGIKAATGSLEDELRRDRVSRTARLPIRHRETKVVTVDSGSDTTAVSLGGPALGRVWHVRRLTVGGAKWSTTVAGTAEVYVAALPPAQMATARDFSMLVDQASGNTPALPAIAFYGEGEVPVEHGEHIIIVIVSGTASTQYVCTAQVMDYNLGLASEVVVQ